MKQSLMKDELNTRVEIGGKDDAGALKHEEEIDELIDAIAHKIMDQYKAAFEELAK